MARDVTPAPVEATPPSDRILRIVDAVGWKFLPEGLNLDALETAIEASVEHYKGLIDTGRIP
jgi:hypothetical protein